MGGSSVDGTARVEKGTSWLGNPGKCIGAREKAHEKNLPAFLSSTWYHLLQVLNIYALLFHLQWPFIVLALIVYQINSYNFIFVPGFIGLFGKKLCGFSCGIVSNCFPVYRFGPRYCHVSYHGDHQQMGAYLRIFDSE